MIKIAIVEREQEYFRFTSKISDADFIVSCDFSGLRSLWSTRTQLLGEVELILVGLRQVDIACILTMSHFCSRVIVLQHAVNHNKTSFTLRFLLTNFDKLFKWVVFTLGLKLFVPLFMRRQKSTTVHLFYFTSYYQSRFATIGLDYESHRCSWPNPFEYGTINPISKSHEPSELFYIDEPLEKTLGLSIDKQVEILRQFMKRHGISTIDIRLHPRSHIDKFSDIPGFNILSDIPPSIDILLGYKSNLLYGDFKSKQFYRLDDEHLSFVKQNQEGISGQYISEVKTKLNEIRSVQQ